MIGYFLADYEWDRGVWSQCISYYHWYTEFVPNEDYHTVLALFWDEAEARKACEDYASEIKAVFSCESETILDLGVNGIAVSSRIRRLTEIEGKRLSVTDA